jgi:hypothetical protein
MAPEFLVAGSSERSHDSSVEPTEFPVSTANIKLRSQRKAECQKARLLIEGPDLLVSL